MIVKVCILEESKQGTKAAVVQYIKSSCGNFEIDGEQGASAGRPELA